MDATLQPAAENQLDRLRTLADKLDCLTESDIMLLGGKEEIDAASKFMVQFEETTEGSLGPVIFALRKSLRNEIGLNDVPMPRPYNLRLHLNDD